MSSLVARSAQGDAVRRVVPELGVGCPRPGVVDVERASASSAVLTRPVIAGEAGIAVRHIRGVLEVRVAERGMPAGPVRVVRPRQVNVGRSDAGGSDTSTDSGPVFGRQGAAPDRCADAVALGLGERPACCRRLPSPRCSYLRPRLGSLRRVVPQVRPGRAAGVRAEPLATTPIGGSALLTHTSRHKTEFTTWS
jgi:hypothetical protein